jgi:hypothetical protein
LSLNLQIVKSIKNNELEVKTLKYDQICKQSSLTMAPVPKKAAVLKCMASLATAGAKRAAEKLSPQKKKKQKVDIVLDQDANDENVTDVFLTTLVSCSPHPRHYNGYSYQLAPPATPSAAPELFSHQFLVHCTLGCLWNIIELTE